jgi:hypothetical protein
MKFKTHAKLSQHAHTSGLFYKQTVVGWYSEIVRKIRKFSIPLFLVFSVKLYSGPRLSSQPSRFYGITQVSSRFNTHSKNRPFSVRFYVVTVVSMNKAAFRIVALCSLVEFYDVSEVDASSVIRVNYLPVDGGGKLFWNVAEHLLDYTRNNSEELPSHVPLLLLHTDLKTKLSSSWTPQNILLCLEWVMSSNAKIFFRIFLPFSELINWVITIVCSSTRRVVFLHETTLQH